MYGQSTSWLGWHDLMRQDNRRRVKHVYRCKGGVGPSLVRRYQIDGTAPCRLPEGAFARQMDFEADIVAHELVLVMDKYTAADVLREVSVYDTINKAARYTSKVGSAVRWRCVGAQPGPTFDGQERRDGAPDHRAPVGVATLLRSCLALPSALNNADSTLPSHFAQCSQSAWTGMPGAVWLAIGEVHLTVEISHYWKRRQPENMYILQRRLRV